jgi:hypothetical protein
MQHDASQNRVNRETQPSKHIETAMQAVVIHDRLLKATEALGRRVASEQEVFPSRVVLVQISYELRSMVHDETKVGEAMKIRNEVVRNPWDGSIIRIHNLKIAQQSRLLYGVIVVMLQEFRVQSPLLPEFQLLQQLIISPKILGYAHEVSELARDLKVLLIQSWNGIGDTQIHRLELDTEIGTTWKN